MALSNMVRKKTLNADGAVFQDIIEFNGDASYATGGADFEALFKSTVGQNREPLFVSGYGGDYSVEFVPSSPTEGAGKLKMRVAAGTEVTPGTNLAAVLFRCLVHSR